MLIAFNEAHAKYVVIGGIAATVHGCSLLTFDLDICYERSRENLKRLVSALQEFHPRLRDLPSSLPNVFDERALMQGTNFTLSTDLGKVDLLGEVSGLGGFPVVESSSEEATIFGQCCRMINLDALIVAKRAAGRPKDLVALAELEALKELRESRKKK